MKHNIILTEAQYKGFEKYLMRERLIREGIEKEYELPAKVYNIKKYLDDLFVKTTVIGQGEFDMPTKKYRCAIAKSQLDEKDAKKYFDEDIFNMLQTHFQRYFNQTEFRDEYLKKIVDKWFRGKIRVVGNGCAILEP